MLRYGTLRLMCALAAMLGRKLYTSDAVQAYLNATLSEPRYGRLPKELREHNSDGVELIAFIRKALYGLAEAGHAWNAENGDSPVPDGAARGGRHGLHPLLVRAVHVRAPRRRRLGAARVGLR